ncbi:von Willebrand factor type A domain-containing protein [uncultured Dokdonia sp.]|uniref:vWA domain-containing protein n=1 Tax=uncultured Dokdonia sp. TaxID=575653 RepID=UPI002613617B|nr:von Willebrand factor type A domain-containing protein [uncultured Dokdonia sp.]
MKTLFKIAFVFFLHTSLYAQIVTITGTVHEENGPLPGASVLVKGTSKMVSTDFDGKYTINALATDVLVFSYVGYMRQEVTVGSQTTIHVTLASNNQLDEVVVVGHGIKREKKALGYAVSTVKSEQLSNRTKGDVGRVLSGKASGVAISNQNGISGSATRVVIRGNSSINGGNQRIEITKKAPVNGTNTTKVDENQPIYIVDGVLIDPSLVSIVAQMDKALIKNKKVYNSKKTTKRFGTETKNGCIVINTKHGNYRVENDESYKALFENQFKSVLFDPLSTMAVDVDKAGYSNIRRMINNGQEIPVDAVKIEEMINYFEYAYTPPTDNKPFAVHSEVIQTPWNKETQLVRIGLKGKELSTDELPVSNLTFLIDVSGSMSDRNKLPLLQSAFEILVKKLRKEDTVSIVVYAGAAGVVLEPTSGDQKETIMKAINNLSAGGSTAGGQGIELAYKIAKEHFVKDGNNRVILATDGDFNVGQSSDKAMQTLIEEKRDSGIFLTCLGFGMGNYKDSKLETLADKGNGNHAYIDTMQEAHKFLGKEFGGTLYTIAKDVKIQVEFNPLLVKSYRLIGYENRLLANEDFDNDAKDAGEIGSGHTVTALYEVVPVDSSYDPTPSNTLKYQKQIQHSNTSNELLTVKFRYKTPEGSKSKLFSEVVYNDVNSIDKASEDVKFIAAVAMFGMQLRDSKYVKDIKQEDVLALAQSGRGEDTDGFRAEFIRLVKAK